MEVRNTVRDSQGGIYEVTSSGRPRKVGERKRWTGRMQIQKKGEESTYEIVAGGTHSSQHTMCLVP